MKKTTKGALAMVLAGSVTFSVITALVVDQSAKQLAEDNALTISGDSKIADITNQAEKTVKDQTADIQQNKEESATITAINSANTEPITTTTPAPATIIAASIKEPKTTTTIPAAVGTTSETTTNKPAAAEAKTTSETTATKPPAAGTNLASETTTNKPTATATNTTSETTTAAATTTTTNHGQQISQAVKERVASRQDKKETNGNNEKKL